MMGCDSTSGGKQTFCNNWTQMRHTWKLSCSKWWVENMKGIGIHMKLIWRWILGKSELKCLRIGPSGWLFLAG